jgi:hypothetical protein
MFTIDEVMGILGSIQQTIPFSVGSGRTRTVGLRESAPTDLGHKIHKNASFILHAQAGSSEKVKQIV